MVYKDSKGIEYQIGDIVFNPCIGDYWVVQEVTEQDKEIYGLETDLCLALYNSKDDYVIDIDEPEGFVIILHKDEPEYKEILEEMALIVKEREERFNGKEKHTENAND